MSKKQSVPLEFTEQHYAALGRVVVEFQSLEQAITFALLRFIHPEEVVPLRLFTQMVLNELSFSNKTKLLAAYCNTHLAKHVAPDAKVPDVLWLKDFEEELSNLRDGIRLANEAEAGRNQMVHSQWLTRPISGPNNTVLRTKFRVSAKKIVASFEYITPEQIAGTVKSAKKGTALIQSAVTHLHFMLQEVAQ